jgi:hypothetical protein
VITKHLCAVTGTFDLDQRFCAKLLFNNISAVQ